MSLFVHFYFHSVRVLLVVLALLMFPSCGFMAQSFQTAADDEEKNDTSKKFFDPVAKELGGRNFMTGDRVLLSGSFYPGHADEDTVPVILLHGQGKSREEFAPLIAEMKKRGYAILAFDFRGHGESTTRFPTPREQMQLTNVNPGMGIPNVGMIPQPQTPSQAPQLIDYLEKDFTKTDYENMYKFDILQFYRFLREENNAKRLNLNKLVIVGVGMGGTVGGRMTKQLWANTKGKNVRSLIIVSPNYDSFSKALFKDSKCFHRDVPLLMIVGQLDHLAKENALSLRDDILGKEKRKEDHPTAMSSPVPVAEFPTERQGGDLLKESKMGVPQKIADYIDETLAKHKEKEFKWRKM